MRPAASRKHGLRLLMLAGGMMLGLWLSNLNESL
jgi:hypothetical protein